MLTGHASHQIGLDADVWLTPMPARTLSREEREEMSAVDMVSEDGRSVDRVALVGGAGGDHPGGGRGAGGRAHLRQRRDQEGALRDPRARILDDQGAPLLGPQLPLPHPHPMPRGRDGLRAAGSGSPRRRLRQIAQLVVHLRSPPPGAGQAKTAAHRGAAPAGVPDGGAGEVGGPGGLAIRPAWRSRILAA